MKVQENEASTLQQQAEENEDHHHHDAANNMTIQHLHAYMNQRIQQLLVGEQQLLQQQPQEHQQEKFTTTKYSSSSISTATTSTTETGSDVPDVFRDDLQWKKQHQQDYIHGQTQQLWNFLIDNNHEITTTTITNTSSSSSNSSATATTTTTTLSKSQFVERLHQSAQAVDFRRLWPLTLSMLMVGSTVGVTTPAMPFVVQNLGLSAGEYGMVVSAFALSKMLGNIPFAVLVERHGRKPYLVYSMIVVSVGVGAIGVVDGFEPLYVSRLLTGLGVAGFSTAATMTVTDISTPLNRASTLAPIMSAFAAGTALGPALGGVLVDELGLYPLFMSVGASYLLLAAVNNILLDETKSQPMTLPWQQQQHQEDKEYDNASKRYKNNNNNKQQQPSIQQAFQDALGQWVPLLSEAQVRNVCIMNAFYWVALAGSQMTLLPLILTNPDGLNMTATQVGQVYMGMSAVQVLGNPVFAKVVDRIGKVPGIVGGCTLISASMFSLPLCDATNNNGMEAMAGVLGMWAVGSTLLSTSPLAYISDRVDDGKRAQAIALLRTSGDVGFLIGASSMGALADWAGSLDVAMQSSSAILGTATVWFALRNLLSNQLDKVSK